MVNCAYFIYKAVMKKLVELTDKVQVLDAKQKEAERKNTELWFENKRLTKMVEGLLGAKQGLLDRVRRLSQQIGQLTTDKMFVISHMAAMLAKDVW